MKENFLDDSINYNESKKEDLIPVNIILEIKMGNENTIIERIRMNFHENITINDMIKEIVPNFNDLLENHDKKIYLNPESNEYQLCECEENNENGIIKFSNGNILEKRAQLLKISSRTFKIICFPKDILFNYERKQNVCDGCLII